jgi:hypothetical protein
LLVLLLAGLLATAAFSADGLAVVFDDRELVDIISPGNFC